eukprot:3938115-Rhodomonas_salina.1
MLAQHVPHVSVLRRTVRLAEQCPSILTPEGCVPSAAVLVLASPHLHLWIFLVGLVSGTAQIHVLGQLVLTTPSSNSIASTAPGRPSLTFEAVTASRLDVDMVRAPVESAVNGTCPVP